MIQFFYTWFQSKPKSIIRHRANQTITYTLFRFWMGKFGKDT